jgi:hypothetical protein
MTTARTGPIYQIKLGLQNVIVISDATTANALLDKKSSIYSSRPRAVMAEEIVSRGLRSAYARHQLAVTDRPQWSSCLVGGTSTV